MTGGRTRIIKNRGSLLAMRQRLFLRNSHIQREWRIERRAACVHLEGHYLARGRSVGHRNCQLAQLGLSSALVPLYSDSVGSGCAWHGVEGQVERVLVVALCQCSGAGSGACPGAWLGRCGHAGWDYRESLVCGCEGSCYLVADAVLALKCCVGDADGGGEAGDAEGCDGGDEC